MREILTTERLRLRCFTLDDEAALSEVFADPEARAFYPEMTTRTAAREWIERNLRRYEAHGLGLWAMVPKESDRLIGDCGLTYQDVEGVEELEIGYHVAAAERRKGYALEAARACLDYGFRNTAADRICSIVRPKNVSSRSVAGRLHVTCREITKKGGAALLFETTRDAWAARRDA